MNGYTFVILNNGREVENIDAGTFDSYEAAESAGYVLLDDVCPPSSPNRFFYCVQVRKA